MAQELTIGTVKVKKRHIFGWFGLSLITFGIYPLVWYFKILSELRDLGAAYDDAELAKINPTMGVIALFVPIANLVSIHRTGGRVRRAQKLVNLPADYSMGIHWLLLILGFWPCYTQSGLNGIWEHGSAVLSGTKSPQQAATPFISA